MTDCRKATIAEDRAVSEQIPLMSPIFGAGGKYACQCDDFTGSIAVRHSP